MTARLFAKYLTKSVPLVLVGAMALSLMACSDLDVVDNTLLRNRNYDYARYPVKEAKPLVLPSDVHVTYQPMNQLPTGPNAYLPVATVDVSPPAINKTLLIVSPEKAYYMRRDAMNKELTALQDELKLLQSQQASGTAIPPTGTSKGPAAVTAPAVTSASTSNSTPAATSAQTVSVNQSSEPPATPEPIPTEAKAPPPAAGLKPAAPKPQAPSDALSMSEAKQKTVPGATVVTQSPVNAGTTTTPVSGQTSDTSSSVVNVNLPTSETAAPTVLPAVKPHTASKTAAPMAPANTIEEPSPLAAASLPTKTIPAASQPSAGQANTTTVKPASSQLIQAPTAKPPAPVTKTPVTHVVHKAQNVPVLQIHSPFNEVWGSIKAALPELGYTIVKADTKAGYFFIAPSQQAAMGNTVLLYVERQGAKQVSVILYDANGNPDASVKAQLFMRNLASAISQ